MLGEARVTHRNTADSDEEEPLREQPALYDELNWAPCSVGRGCSFLMVPFVVGLVGLTWVPYIQVFGDGSFSGFVCLAIFHILLFLLLLSYFQAVVSKHDNYSLRGTDRSLTVTVMIAVIVYRSRERPPSVAREGCINAKPGVQEMQVYTVISPVTFTLLQHNKEAGFESRPLLPMGGKCSWI